MKHKMKQAISLLCALVLVVTSCFVEEAMTATASETNSNDVVRYVNPAIPVNVGETIDLTKYDVELSKDEATASTELTWYGQVETNTVPYTAPAIGVNVGETINLANYKVEFTKGVASFVDTWKDGNNEITAFTAEATGVTTLTAVSGENSKSIYVVAKNPEDTEYVLYRNDFNGTTATDLQGITTKVGSAANVSFSVENGVLTIVRNGVAAASAWHESYVMLPEWIGDFGDYKTEISTKIIESVNAGRYIAVVARAQDQNNVETDYPQPYPYYYTVLTAGKTARTDYRDINGKNVGDTDALGTAGDKIQVANAVSSTSEYFTLATEMQGNTLNQYVNGTKISTTNTEKLHDIGLVGIYANGAKVAVDYIKVTLVESETESATETTKITSFTPNEAGVTELTVKDSADNEKTIYVVAKNPQDTEWVLYENDFNSGLDGIELVEGTPNSAVVDTENGQFNLDIKWRGNYRFPEWLGDFGNYRIVMTETCTSYASSNNRISLFARGQENNKYTPNYTVKLSYKGWNWDSVLLTKRLAWTDADTNWKWEDIAWGKYNSMEANTAYTHEMNVQDDLIEYKINDETILYDIRERDLATGHVGFMFDGNGNSDKISIDSVRVVFCPDMTVPEAPTTATYSRTTNTAGMADGKVNVTLATSGSAAKDVVCYWGNGTGKLAGYTNFAKALVEEGATSVTVNLGENIMIPQGATELRVYTENIAGESENCVCVPLPDGVSALETGNEVISFQVISDTHIKEDNAHYNTTHLQTFLNSVSANDPNSVGIFVGGDLVDNGTEAEYQNFQNIWNSVEGLPEMYAVIGNHEFWSGDWDATMEMFYTYTGTTEPYYHKEVNGYDFIFLASTEEESDSPTNAILGSEQVAWLEKTLEEQAETDKPIFVFLHQPLNNTVAGSTDKDVQETEEVKAILAEYPQAFLFTSHSHMNLDTPGTMIAADGTVCNLFNTAAVSYLMNTHYTSRSFMSEEAQGYYVEVYEDKVLVRGKNLLTDEWLPSSQFVVSFEWDYEFDAEIGSSDVSDLDDAFDVYQFNAPTTVENTTAVIGPKDPSENNTASDNSAYSYFTSEYIGSYSVGGLRPTSNPGYTVLTYEKEALTNFEAEYEVYANTGTDWGIMFGSEKGIFPVSRDGDNTNDTGVLIAVKENGSDLFVGGKINTSSITVPDGLATDINDNKWIPSFNQITHIRVKEIFVDLPTPTQYKRVTEETETQTICVKVENGVLSVFEKSNPENVFTIELVDYEGGYVSFFTNNHTNGAFKSFKIKKIKTWDYDITAVIGGSSVSYLDEAFDVYQYKKPSTSTDTTSVVGPVEPSATDPNSYKGGDSYYTTKAYGSKSRGGLKPTYIQGGDGSGYTTLTYTKEIVKDFEAEYDYYSSWSTFGFVFGGKLGSFPLSQDGDSTNDAGVAIYMSDNGTLYVYGAIDTNSVTSTAGISISKNITNAAPVLNTANLRATGMTNGESIAVSENITENSDFFTVCIKVEDGILTIHEKDHPDKSISVALADTYVGGYVSLMSNQTQHGAFRGFRISKISENYNVAALGLSGLNNHFDSYYFEDGVDVVKGKPSEQWFLDPSKGENYAWYYQNWYLKPVHRNASGTKRTLLTLKNQTVTNFEANVEYNAAYTEYGLIIAPKGELANSENGVRVDVNSSGQIKINGAIDVRSASWSGAGVCTSSAEYSLLGPTLSGYVAPKTDGTTNKTSYILNVKVKDGKLTASVDGFKGELTVNLTANYKGGSISLYSTGYDQGGFKNFEVKALEAPGTISRSEVPLSVVSMGDYVAVTMSTEVAYSIINGTLSYDTEKFEYIKAIFADGQTTVNADAEIVANDGSISIQVLANSAGDVVTLCFKEKVDTLNYSGFEFTNPAIVACGDVSVARVDGSVTVQYDYTQNKVIDVKDLVRGKINTVDEVTGLTPLRKTLVGNASQSDDFG